MRSWVMTMVKQVGLRLLKLVAATLILGFDKINQSNKQGTNLSALRLAYRSMLGNLNLRVFQKLDLSEAYGTQ